MLMEEGELGRVAQVDALFTASAGVAARRPEPVAGSRKHVAASWARQAENRVGELAGEGSGQSRGAFWRAFSSILGGKVAGR